MDRRKAALILSFVYCGLGQVYKGEILKGTNFVIIYTLLVISLFLRPFSPILNLFCFFILLLMWMMGMADAYVEDEGLIGKDRLLIWQKPLAGLSFAVISGAIITLVILWVRPLPANESMVHKDETKAQPYEEHGAVVDESSESDVQVPENGYMIHKDNSEVCVVAPPAAEDQSAGSEFFSIRVAAFRNMENGEKFYRELLSKGYPARIEYSTSTGGKWSYVLVGRFVSKQSAIALAEELRKQEGLSYVLVRRRATEETVSL